MDIYKITIKFLDHGKFDDEDFDQGRHIFDIYLDGLPTEEELKHAINMINEYKEIQTNADEWEEYYDYNDCLDIFINDLPYNRIELSGEASIPLYEGSFDWKGCYRKNNDKK